MITLEDLQKQLASSEQQLEEVKASANQLVGVIQLLKFQITKFDKPAEPQNDSGTS